MLSVPSVSSVLPVLSVTSLIAQSRTRRGTENAHHVSWRLTFSGKAMEVKSKETYTLLLSIQSTARPKYLKLISLIACMDMTAAIVY